MENASPQCGKAGKKNKKAAGKSLKTLPDGKNMVFKEIV